ncbi:MAG: hypothetical protein V4592_18000 [Bacteroidota bacterium]
MAWKMIDDAVHGLLLHQLTLLPNVSGHAELDLGLRELYARHHDLHIEQEKVLREYNRKARQVRKLLPEEFK